MLQPGRHANTGNYRYGFNGKELDNEIKGDGAQYDYGFRIYDPRVGKFLSKDPLFKTYPWFTPYQFAGNSPIWAIDLDGLESKIVIHTNNGPPKVLQETEDNRGIKWRATREGYFKAFGTHENFTSGQEEYTKYKDFSPTTGTLTIDATGNVAQVRFEKGTFLDNLSHSIISGMGAVDVLFIHPNELVAGSQKFKNTVDGYITLVTLPITFEALLANPKNMVNISSVLNDLDELSGGEKGSVLLQLSEGNDSAETVVISLKTLTSFTAKNASLKDFAVDAKTNSEKLKALITAAKNTKDTFSGLEKIKENVNENKNDEQ